MHQIKAKFEEIISFRREWEKNAGFSKPHERNTIRDFQHLEEIIESTLAGIPLVSNLLSGTHITASARQHFLMKLTIAFNLRFYDALLVKSLEHNFFHWSNKVADSAQKSFILLLWKQNFFSVISSYSLLLNSLQYQSMQILRGYIESTAILYLSLIDYEFLEKYTTSNIPEEEYMKIWFKHMKPSIVKKQIKNIHNAWRFEDDTAGIRHIGLRSMSDNILTSDFVEHIYQITSDYMHFKKNAIFNDAWSAEEEKLFLGTTSGSTQSIDEVLNAIIQLFSLSSGMLEIAVNSHLPNVIQYNEIMGDLSALNAHLHADFI